MKAVLLTSLRMLAVLTFLTGVVYPLVVTALAQVVFPSQAGGSLVVWNGTPVGSALVGQSFTAPRYVWGRPSATAPTPYNAAASGGSNLGPLNPTLRDRVKSRIDALRTADPTLRQVPVDLVTASGSGLDPHLSPAAAAAQVRRVAKARGKSEDEIRRLVARYTEGRQLGLLGEPRVNVLLLNLALDGKSPDPPRLRPSEPLVLTRWPRPTRPMVMLAARPSAPSPLPILASPSNAVSPRAKPHIQDTGPLVLTRWPHP